MPFNEVDKKILLDIKGVGETVISRLEEYGFSTLEELADANVDHIISWVSDNLKSTCWKNSPHARNAITSSIEVAKKSIQ